MEKNRIDIVGEEYSEATPGQRAWQLFVRDVKLLSLANYPDEMIQEMARQSIRAAELFDEVLGWRYDHKQNRD